MLSSNLHWGTCYKTRCNFSQPLPPNAKIVPSLCHDHFLQNPFNFIMHSLSYHRYHWYWQCQFLTDYLHITVIHSQKNAPVIKHCNTSRVQFSSHFQIFAHRYFLCMLFNCAVNCYGSISVSNEWMRMEHWWTDTDKNKWSMEKTTCPSGTLYTTNPINLR